MTFLTATSYLKSLLNIFLGNKLLIAQIVKIIGDNDLMNLIDFELFKWERVYIHEVSEYNCFIMILIV